MLIMKIRHTKTYKHIIYLPENIYQQSVLEAK